MDENKIRSIVSSMLSSFSNSVVPWHVHNGSDSPRIDPRNLLPYPVSSGTIVGSPSAAPTGKTNATDGTIQFYDVQNSPNMDWGLDIALGGIWNPMTLVPSGMGANLATAQTFADATPATLIADNVFYDLYPSTGVAGAGTITVSAGGTAVTGSGTAFLVDFFVGSTISSNGETHTVMAIADNTHMTTDAWTHAVVAKPYIYLQGEYTPDGTFTCTTAGQYFVNAGVTFDNTGAASGSCIITIALERNAVVTPYMRKNQSFATTDTSFTVDISGIIQTLGNDLLYVVVEQFSGGPLTTLTDIVDPTNPNQWLNVQKMK